MTEDVTAPAEDEQKSELLPVPVFTHETLLAVPPRFYVLDDALHATTVDGAKFVIPLRVPTKHVAEIEDLGSALDQLRALAELRLDPVLPEALDEMDIIDAREIARKFFQAFTEKEQARLGESFGSSAT